MKSSKEIYANVLFPHPPYQRFTYSVPEEFQHNLCVGHRVLVPLGKRRVTGFVVSLSAHHPARDLRDIADLLDPYPCLTPQLLRLTRWIGDYYMAGWGEVLRIALPPGIHRQSSLKVRLKANPPNPNVPFSKTESQIINILGGKPSFTLRQLETKLGKKSLRFHIGKLSEAGQIEIETILDNAAVGIRSETWISIKPGTEAPEIELRKKRAPRQALVLEQLLRHGGEMLRTEIDVESGVLKTLRDKGWIEMWEEEVYRDGYAELDIPPPDKLDPNPEQERAIEEIKRRLRDNQFAALLLYGVTGSGKTHVYIESIRQTLKDGKTALILIPEISLTPQAVIRFRSCFGEEVAVLHSRMAPGERYDAWRSLREGKKRIAIGPRSAVFAPLENIGLIVVDEEHVESYKQEEPAPRYHARDVAVMRAKLDDAVIVLGSATPSLESYTNAMEGKYTLCELKNRVDGIPMPTVSVVNMRSPDEKDPHAALSPLLLEAIRGRWTNHEQTILLQNRRGYSPFLLCGDCGDVPKCPRCDITLTYHRHHVHLKCHYCGFQKSVPEICPSCGGANFHYRGLGTQRIEEELQQTFSGINILRMDQDTTRRKGSHAKIVTDFAQGHAEILLGTQMVAKGHDFPGVRLVGVINADTGLYFPDFRSSERTFQLLTQAAGRSGRTVGGGTVIVQTGSPDHPALRFSVNQDYTGFYAWESEQRKSLNYPPWGRLIMVMFKGRDENRTMAAAKEFTQDVPRLNFLDLLGPCVAPLARIRNLYRVQVIFRSSKSQDPTGRKLRKTVQTAMAHYRKHIKDSYVRVSVNVDPSSML